MKLFLFLILTTAIYASQSLSFGGAQEEKSNETVYKKVYGVRFLSLPLTISNKEILLHIPQSIRKNTQLIKSGNYMTALYQERMSIEESRQDLKKIQSMGYEDAFIRSSEKRFFTHKKNIKMIKSSENRSLKKEHLQRKKSLISKFTKANIITKANAAYKKKDYMQVIIYYEMLLASNNSTHKINSNLCYLYGRVGAFAQAEDIINREKYPSKLIYAYAYGAAITGQESFYNDMSPYIALDRTGRLMLLSGYYFEQKQNNERALAFYKMAYNANPSDIYTLYAYARAQDMNFDLESAERLYNKILLTADKSTQIYKQSLQRVYQLKDSNIKEKR